MLPFAIFFLLGDLFLQQFKTLPSIHWCYFAISIACIFLLTHKKIFKYIAASLLGFSWTLYFTCAQLSWSLPENLEGKPVEITGYVASIPNTTPQSTAFLFRLKKFNQQPAHGLLKLSWRYAHANIFAGDKWCLKVRLKKIHSLMNPGGFDYEAWALQENIRAQGYVIDSESNQLLPMKNHFSMNYFRQRLKNAIETNLTSSQTSPWIVALALGERHNIAADQWDILRNTGTNHLMAIAGLHIGFMSGFIFFMVSWIWRRMPFVALRMPAQHAGALAALGMATLYGILAGFSIPTQRALMMLIVFLVILLLRRTMIAWLGWGIALFLVLLLNPLCVLAESFWLSFGSVAYIIYGVSGRLHPTGVWWKCGRIQWVIAIGLIPLGIWLFQQFSLVSFIANSIAIPWVGFIIVPLTLFGCFLFLFSDRLAGIFLHLADINLTYLWKVLTYLSHLSWASWYQYVPNTWMLLVACVGILILLVPIGFPGRWLGAIWLLPVLLYRPMQPQHGEAKFTLLDVGQGLSAVVETRHHLLVFDTGARLGENYDMGSSVVIPFLRTLHVNHIDMMVISHGDNDHMGGANSILKQFPVTVIKTSVPDYFSQYNARDCLQNETWEWDGVDFSFFNNRSACVLKMSTQHQAILLTSDIGKIAEDDLVLHAKNNLRANLLVAPHYGSKTSAQDDFLDAVHPEDVLFSVGYRNRYHFPNAEVVQKYRDRQVATYDSVTDGAIQFDVFANDVTGPYLYRITHQHYWNH